MNFPPDVVPYLPSENVPDDFPDRIAPGYSPSEAMNVCNFVFWQGCSIYRTPNNPDGSGGRDSRRAACEGYVTCMQGLDNEALPFPNNRENSMQACMMQGPSLRNPWQWIPDYNSTPGYLRPGHDWSPQDIFDLFPNVCPWNEVDYPNSDREIVEDFFNRRCEAPYKLRGGLCCTEPTRHRRGSEPGIWGCYDPNNPDDQVSCTTGNVGKKVRRSQLIREKVRYCPTHSCLDGPVDVPYLENSFGSVEKEYICQCPGGESCRFVSSGRICEKLQRQSCQINQEVDCHGPDCFRNGRFYQRQVVDIQGRDQRFGELCGELGLVKGEIGLDKYEKQNSQEDAVVDLIMAVRMPGSGSGERCEEDIRPLKAGQTGTASVIVVTSY